MGSPRGEPIPPDMGSIHVRNSPTHHHRIPNELDRYASATLPPRKTRWKPTHLGNPSAHGINGLLSDMA